MQWAPWDACKMRREWAHRPPCPTLPGSPAGGLCQTWLVRQPRSRVPQAPAPSPSAAPLARDPVARWLADAKQVIGLGCFSPASSNKHLLVLFHQSRSRQGLDFPSPGAFALRETGGVDVYFIASPHTGVLQFCSRFEASPRGAICPNFSSFPEPHVFAPAGAYHFPLKKWFSY